MLNKFYMLGTLYRKLYVVPMRPDYEELVEHLVQGGVRVEGPQS